jgi:hypothetical protein
MPFGKEYYLRMYDLTGKKFGDWTVLRKGDVRKGRPYWWCVCKCGLEKQVDGASLRNGDSTGCKECGRKKIPGRTKGYRAPYEDITGKVFGHLTVTSMGGRLGTHRAWWCQCDCGSEPKLVREFALKNGKIKSCGCRSRSAPLPDKTGQKFGMLTVLSLGENIGPHRAWNCRCDCGNEKLIRDFWLTSGQYKSCGCNQYSGLQHKFPKKHGKSQSRVYSIWRGMVRRCTDPDQNGFQNYGGRGIKVCERWMTFENFYADMGDPPTEFHTLERLNNDGNYEPENCIWSTRSRSARNRRITTRINVEGKSVALEDIADAVGVSSKVLRYHLSKGRTIAQAVAIFKADPQV